MLIAVAGPYSAPTPEERQANLDAMNRAAAEVLRRGHVPVIGVNAALPVVAMAPELDRYDAIMAISLGVVGGCDAILMIGESPGANRERELLAAMGRPIYTSVDEIPEEIAMDQTPTAVQPTATNALVPMVHVADVPRSIDFYARLGFEVSNTFVPEGESSPAWAWLSSGNAHLMVTRADEPVDDTKQGVLFYAYCPDVEAMHRELAAKSIVVGPIHQRFYAPNGEFRITDPDGYVVMMMQE